MMEFFAPEAMWALFNVIMIDLVLAGDNAIVIGMAAAGLPAEQRKKAILLGIIAATVMRIGFALITVQLLQIVGLLLIGGLMLLWVCWKMWKELREGHGDANEALQSADIDKDGKVAGHAAKKTFAAAAWQIVVADVTMSLDNVLAVAGAAKDHPYIMVVGLALSIALMGFAASFIANLLNKYRWIGYIGLAIIVYVSLTMMYHGGQEVMAYMNGTVAAH